jgi:hypothetical protein
MPSSTSTTPAIQRGRELRRLLRQMAGAHRNAERLLAAGHEAEVCAVLAQIAHTISRGVESLVTPPHKAAAPGTANAEGRNPINP